MVTINKKAMIFLDRNENQYGPSPACFKVLQNSNEETLNIYSRDFTRGIKSLLSERLAHDFGTEEKKILLGYGSEDILKQAVQCYLNKGEKIMIPSYSWWYYKKIADDAEGISIQYPIVEGVDTFYYDIEGMIEVYNEQKPKLILISSPNNPTGNRLETEQLNFVLDKMKDSIVVLDEAYLLFDETYKTDPVGLVNRFPNLIIIRTFSKYYALAGIRTGFAFLGDNHDRISLLSTRYLGFNRLSEKIAIAALDSPEYYNSIGMKMASDMEMLYNELNQLPGFTAYRSFANFILVKIPSEIKDPLKKYLTERNMIVKFMNEEGLDRHIRITIGTHPQNCMLLKLIRFFMCKEIKHELVQGV
jgi:Histidinol-phosphate/aromatic aminotransferase and cobyric acid decarboxylase